MFETRSKAPFGLLGMVDKGLGEKETSSVKKKQIIMCSKLRQFHKKHTKNGHTKNEQHLINRGKAKCEVKCFHLTL